MRSMLKRIAQDERLLVERLGMFNRICGPGWQFLLPLVESGVVLRLDERLPGWRAFEEEPLRQRLKKDYYEQLARSL